MLLTYLALMHHLPVVSNGCPKGTCVAVECGSGFVFIVVASEMVKGECDVDVFFFFGRQETCLLATGMCPKKKEQQTPKNRTRSGFIDFIRTLVAL